MLKMDIASGRMETRSGIGSGNLRGRCSRSGDWLCVWSDDGPVSVCVARSMSVYESR